MQCATLISLTEENLNKVPRWTQLLISGVRGGLGGSALGQPV